jgi:signal transduction histidine kinase
VTPPADHAVLRIAQEGIANAVRHADAQRIELELVRREGRTELVVADDGRGFDQAAADKSYGLGLRVMRERLRELGGSLVITSEIGRGTRLVATIP